MRESRRRFIRVSANAVMASLGLHVTRALATSSPRSLRVGIITTGTAQRWAYIENAFTEGMRELGYSEDRNLTLHKRKVSASEPRRMVDGVAELIEQRVEAIVTSCGWGTSVAMNATKTIPIVFAGIADPVGRGFVKSLAHPGGNVTGASGLVPDLAPKMVDYLRLALPNVTVVAALLNGSKAEHARQLASAQQAASAIGVNLVPVKLQVLADERSAAEALRRTGAQAVIALPQDELVWQHLDAILAAAAELQLPTFFPKRDAVDLGGFMSYGADAAELMKRSATYVDRIANGASPSALPVELARRLEFVVNMRRAAEFGIALPRAAMVRVDVVVR